MEPGSLQVNLRRLSRGSVSLTGEVSQAELEIDTLDELVKVSGPISYQFNAERQGGAVLATGSFRFQLECLCARCLKPFAREVCVPDWAVLLPLEGEDQVPVIDDCVDLTPFLREDTVLALPQHPLCDQNCRGLPSGSPRVVQEPGEVLPKQEDGSVWSALDKLEL